MNNPSPFVPQGSNLEQKNRARARVRIAVFIVISVNVVGLMAMLMSGCRKPAEPEAALDTNLVVPPVLDVTNLPAVDTNLAVTPPAVDALPPTVVATQEYTVVAGDTFSSIATKFGVRVKQIQDANPTVQPTRLQIGTKLVIPPPTAPTAPAVPGATATDEQSYTVKSGDTLTGIAKDHNTTVRALRSANNLTTDRIRVGQKLIIPKAEAPAPPPPVAPAPAPAPAPMQ